jgi:hypothetical protein
MPHNFSGTFRNVLGLVKFCAKIHYCSETLTIFHLQKSPRANEKKNLLKIVITGDKASVYGYDLETKQQSHTGRVLLHLASKKA